MTLIHCPSYQQLTDSNLFNTMDTSWSLSLYWTW